MSQKRETEIERKSERSVSWTMQFPTAVKKLRFTRKGGAVVGVSGGGVMVILYLHIVIVRTVDMHPSVFLGFQAAQLERCAKMEMGTSRGVDFPFLSENPHFIARLLMQKWIHKQFCWVNTMVFRQIINRLIVYFENS